MQCRAIQQADRCAGSQKTAFLLHVVDIIGELVARGQSWGPQTRRKSMCLRKEVTPGLIGLCCGVEYRLALRRSGRETAKGRR